MSAPTMDPRRLDAFVDGELDLTRQLEVEAELAADERLRAEVEARRREREAVRRDADYHAAPAVLRERMRALCGAASVATPAAPAHRAVPWRRFALPSLAAGLLAWLVTGVLWTARHDERVWQEAVTSHVRASLSQHVVDVASSDRHTVKPWLSSRLDFSPPVSEPKLPELSFIGGRVDVLDGRPVAVLVYRQRAHAIDVFIAPTQEGDREVALASERGFHVVQRVHAGMRYWVVSDLNAQELAMFARALTSGDGGR